MLQSLQASQYFSQVMPEEPTQSITRNFRRNNNRDSNRASASLPAFVQETQAPKTSTEPIEKTIASFGTLKITSENDLNLSAVQSLEKACKSKDLFEALNSKYFEFLEGSLAGCAFIKELAVMFGAEEMQKICKLILYLETNFEKKKNLASELTAYINKASFFNFLMFRMFCFRLFQLGLNNQSVFWLGPLRQD